MIPRLPKGFSHPMPIGKGSFASVFRARQTALDRWVAIKILGERSPRRRGELLKEAKRQAQLRVAGIPAIYDAFEWRGQVCIVMQWIKGVTLDALIEKGIAASHRPALASAIVASLAALHRLGYAHRDLKPANILVSPEEGVFLVDFGFAKEVANPEQSLADAIIGTPYYMAPELWKAGDKVDFLRADLYALGKIFRRLEPGAGWEPFVGDLLREDPALRPADAMAAWKSRESLLAGLQPCDWKALAGAAAAEALAADLLQAARNLLFAGREEEAYWLAIECLEADPDSAEAVKLLDQVPGVSRRRLRLRRVWRSALAAGFALAVAGAFLLGRQAGGNGTPARAAAGAAARAFLPASADRASAPPRALPLREFAGQGGLSGKLSVRDAGRCDSLGIDGVPVAPAVAEAGMTMRAGEHQLACRCASPGAASIRRERISLLPFQGKIVSLCPSDPAGGGA